MHEADTASQASEAEGAIAVDEADPVLARGEAAPCPHCAEPFPHHLLWLERTENGVMLTYRCIACSEVFPTLLST